MKEKEESRMMQRENAVNIDYGREFAFRHLVLKYVLELVGS